MIIFVGTPETKVGCSLLMTLENSLVGLCVVLSPKLALHYIVMHEYVEIDIRDNIDAIQIWSKNKLGDRPAGTSARCHLYPRTE